VLGAAAGGASAQAPSFVNITVSADAKWNSTVLSQSSGSILESANGLWSFKVAPGTVSEDAAIQVVQRKSGASKWSASVERTEAGEVRVELLLSKEGRSGYLPRLYVDLLNNGSWAGRPFPMWDSQGRRLPQFTEMARLHAPGASLSLSDHGCLRLRDQGGRALWTVPTDCVDSTPVPENTPVLAYATPIRGIGAKSEPLWSPSHKFLAKMDSDGRFKLLRASDRQVVATLGKADNSSGTGSSLESTADGRLRIVDARGAELWSASLEAGVGTNGGKLVVSDKGCLWFCRRSGNFVKLGVGLAGCDLPQPCASDTLRAGESVEPGLQLTSNSGRWHAVMGTSGHLVIRNEITGETGYSSKTTAPEDNTYSLSLPQVGDSWGIAKRDGTLIKSYKPLPSAYRIRHTWLVLDNGGCLRHMIDVTTAWTCIGTRSACAGCLHIAND
jgi:hypothetical protein